MLLVRVLHEACACTACCLCVWTTLVRVLHVACACGQPLCVYCMLLVCVLLDNINPTPHKNTHTHIYRVGHNHIDTVYIR
jgi:Na+/glutamate symporter